MYLRVHARSACACTSDSNIRVSPLCLNQHAPTWRPPASPSSLFSPTTILLSVLHYCAGYGIGLQDADVIHRHEYAPVQNIHRRVYYPQHLPQGDGADLGGKMKTLLGQPPCFINGIHGRSEFGTYTTLSVKHLLSSALSYCTLAVTR